MAYPEALKVPVRDTAAPLPCSHGTLCLEERGYEVYKIRRGVEKEKETG